MRTHESCIRHHDARSVPLRRDLMYACDDDAICALLLAQMEYRTNAMIEAAERARNRNAAARAAGDTSPADRDDLWFYYPNADIMDDLSGTVDLRTIQRKVRWLKDRGYIESIPDPNDGRQSLYRLVVPAIQARCDAWSAILNRRQNVANPPESMRQNVANNSRQNVADLDYVAKVDDNFAEIDDTVSPMHDNLSPISCSNPPLENLKNQEISRPAGRAAVRASAFEDRRGVPAITISENPGDLAGRARQALLDWGLSPEITAKILSQRSPDCILANIRLVNARNSRRPEDQKYGEKYLRKAIWENYAAEPENGDTPGATASEREDELRRQRESRTYTRPVSAVPANPPPGRTDRERRPTAAERLIAEGGPPASPDQTRSIIADILRKHAPAPDPKAPNQEENHGER